MNPGAWSVRVTLAILSPAASLQHNDEPVSRLKNRRDLAQVQRSRILAFMITQPRRTDGMLSSLFSQRNTSAGTEFDRGRMFAAVAGYYRTLQQSFATIDVSLPYRLTSLGAWAASRAPHVFWFFKRISLERYDLLIDLGSGDGVVACIAGLFTKSMGVEADPVLCELAQRAATDLGLAERVSFVCGDYLAVPIQMADCLYLYPDKPFDKLEELLANWRGTLLVYGPHFAPRTFSSVSRLRRGREQMVIYRNPSERASYSSSDSGRRL